LPLTLEQYFNLSGSNIIWKYFYSNFDYVFCLSGSPGRAGLESKKPGPEGQKLHAIVNLFKNVSSHFQRITASIDFIDLKSITLPNNPIGKFAF